MESLKMYHGFKIKLLNIKKVSALMRWTIINNCANQQIQLISEG